jgi:glycosyltransferase involved in cell wall biosynthesis
VNSVIPGLVSVTTPFLNVERYLEETIEGVLAQTYPDWELLLIDDGSTDRSATIARTYAGRSGGRVRYLQHPDHANHGVSAARNLGLAQARGEFVAMLDGDDVWLPHKLEEQVALLRAHPSVGLVYGRTVYWHGWTGQPADQGLDHVPGLGVPPGDPIDGARLLQLFVNGAAAVPPPSSVLLRRELAEAVGGSEAQFRGMYEDQVFYAKLLLGSSALPVDECWDRYRQHGDSTCARAARTGSERGSRLRYLTWIESYLRARPQHFSRRLRWTVRLHAWRCRHPQVDDAIIGLARFRARQRARFGRTRGRRGAELSSTGG